MIFAVQINSSPYHSNAGLYALNFVTAVLAEGHQVFRVFFYHDGIYHALRYSTPPDDEINLSGRWRALAEQFNVDLVVCISAGQRRGLLCADEARHQGKGDNDLAEGFRISGLGQWVEASLVADRCIFFG